MIGKGLTARGVHAAEWKSGIKWIEPKVVDPGKLTSPGHLTVLHNGVLIQNHFELLGATAWHKPPEHEPHPPKAPLHLQNHGNPVRFRNIWIRELGVTSEIETEEAAKPEEAEKP